MWDTLYYCCTDICACTEAHNVEILLYFYFNIHQTSSRYITCFVCNMYKSHIWVCIIFLLSLLVCCSFFLWLYNTLFSTYSITLYLAQTHNTFLAVCMFGCCWDLDFWICDFDCMGTLLELGIDQHDVLLIHWVFIRNSPNISSLNYQIVYQYKTLIQYKFKQFFSF